MKNTITKIFYMGCIVMLLAAGFVTAQTTVFTYQGRLNDGATPASGTYQMEIALFDALSGGTQIGSTQTFANVGVSNGNFTVQVDFGAAAFSGANRFIEVRVKKPADPGYTTLAPRQQVTSAPYSVRALNATNVETTTAGNSVINAINDPATNITINDNRLPANLVRLRPSLTQLADSGAVSDAALDITGRQDIGGGNFTNLSNFRLNVDGGFTVSGTQGAGAVPTTGAGARMMWYPGKYAFRAGRVDGAGAAYWDEANIGNGSIGLGNNVRASGANSFAANSGTTASGNESVALGSSGTASGIRSFAFNGTASDVGAIAMGSGAQAINDDSIALGLNSIAGGVSSVAIGQNNRAYGNFSVAIGRNASTCSTWDCSSGARNGSIVISDACSTLISELLTPSADNQINIRGCGGFRFFTNQGLTVGVVLSPGSGTWNTVSDRNMKENFATVNTREILKKVITMPVTTWNYKSQDKSIRHIGVMAQDFHEKFGVGESDKMIATIDPDGVAFAAIQGLNEKLEERTTELQKENDSLKEQLRQQQATIDALKKLVCTNNSEAEICKK